jgi:hypothetical protein
MNIDGLIILKFNADICNNLKYFAHHACYIRVNNMSGKFYFCEGFQVKTYFINVEIYNWNCDVRKISTLTLTTQNCDIQKNCQFEFLRNNLIQILNYESIPLPSEELISRKFKNNFRYVQKSK